jgi:hypothetical protein
MVFEGARLRLRWFFGRARLRLRWFLRALVFWTRQASAAMVFEGARLRLRWFF